MSTSRRTAPWIWGAATFAVLLAGGITAFVASDGSDDVQQSVLHADTRMGAVELKVRDLEAMTAFYGADGVGLELLSEGEGTVSLGVDDEEIIRLTHADGEYASVQDAGLYHSAVLYPDGPALAETMVRMATQHPYLYQGASDHRVSEAFYFGDPEGNGVELYIDRPSDEWTWDDGQVVMGSAALDPNAFIQEHLGRPSTGEATMGHVHLKVGNLDAARAFYADTLGFAVTSESDGAIFMSAGGYHHHLAANTWGSDGADARPEGLGLGEVEVVLPAASDIDGVGDRLELAGLLYDRDEAGLTVADPWGNQVRFVQG